MAILYGTYSFANVVATFTGPGGVFALSGPETGAAEEAVTIAQTSESNIQQGGADGSVMNSLSPLIMGTATFRFQKFSPNNRMLSQLFNIQRQSSATWGKNLITVRDTIGGDFYTLFGCAFVRHANNGYAIRGNVLDWEWQVARIEAQLGDGYITTLDVPSIA